MPVAKKKPKLTKKINKLIKDKYYPKKPTVKTGSTLDKETLDKLKNTIEELKIEVLWTHLRNNRKELSARFGKRFDDFYERVSKKPLIQRHKSSYLGYLKQIKSLNILTANQAFTEGLLTPVEYDKLEGVEKQDYIKLLVNRPDKLAFYIMTSNRDSWGNKRPTDDVIKKWNKFRDIERDKRDKTWWRPLTEAQKHHIIVTTKPDEPYTYEGKPLSKANEYEVKMYKNSRPLFFGYQDAKKFVKSKPVIFDFKGLNEWRAKQQFLAQAIKQQTAKERQILDKLKENFDVVHTNKGKRGDFTIHYPAHAKANIEVKSISKTNGVPDGHGLNAFKKKKNITKNLDIAEAYINEVREIEKNKNGKLSYYVNSYQNTVALAEAVGMLPVEMFQTICHQIIKRKKHFEKEQLLKLGNAVEELVTTYLDRKNKAFKQFDIKISVKKFFNSNERKEWSKKYNYDWSSYTRFNEDFSEWVTIFTSQATKK